MSRNYDNWEKLVGAVVRREKDRQLALFQSFSSSSSAGVSSHFSSDYALLDADLTSPLDFDHFNAPAVSGSLRLKLNPADLFSQETFLFRDVKAIVYEEIKKATKNFNPDLLLGEGGFGPVYKGWIHQYHLRATKPGSGMPVAVKKLNTKGFQGHNEWVDEIHYLSQLRNPNIVKLIGYSFDSEDNRIVVYEFMPNGSLDNHLFTRSGNQSLPWATRMRVGLGAAKAVACLHNLETPVIHRNIMSSNILLDGEFQTKLSAFSLAIDGPSGDMTHVEALVMATYGYAAPEYVATGELTTICDVYGFGVVLVELICGLRVIDRSRADDKHDLIRWGKRYLKDKRKLQRIMDTKLDGQYPPKEAFKVAQIALQCLNLDPTLRPRMTEVVALLEKL